MSLYIRPDRLDLISNNLGYLITASAYSRAVLDILIEPTDSYANTASIIAEEAQHRTSCSRLVSAYALDQHEGNDNIIAHHPVFGLIRARNYYDFSSMEMERNLKRAEDDPRVMAHFIHISSGGGEAWYLDRLYQTITQLEKPVYAHFERLCCSAAYYIACCAQRITAETRNCTVGSIGTMAVIQDPSGLMKKLGINVQELYATNSDLKNAKYNEAKDGNPDRIITEELNPLRDQFAEAVRSSRAMLAKYDDAHPIFRGEDYSASDGVALGLLDGICTLNEALNSCVEAGEAYHARTQNRQKALQYI